MIDVVPGCPDVRRICAEGRLVCSSSSSRRAGDASILSAPTTSTVVAMRRFEISPPCPVTTTASRSIGRDASATSAVATCPAATVTDTAFDAYPIWRKFIVRVPAGTSVRR
jgi:hypothetical protein